MSESNEAIERKEGLGPGFGGVLGRYAFGAALLGAVTIWALPRPGPLSDPAWTLLAESSHFESVIGVDSALPLPAPIESVERWWNQLAPREQTLLDERRREVAAMTPDERRQLSARLLAWRKLSKQERDLALEQHRTLAGER